MAVRKYHPEGLYVWDTQYMVWNGRVHVYHLQTKTPGSTRDDTELDNWGHAISDDLITWEERPSAFGPGPPGTDDDDGRPNTGCVIPHENKVYLFYWMRKQGRPGGATGVAIGDTPDHFERYPGNPVLEPDPEFFYSPSNPMRFGKWMEVRDVMVLPVPERGGFFAYYGSKLLNRKMGAAGAVGVAYSRDLLHWEHRGVAFDPGDNGNVDVVDAFPLDGRWYMTNLTATHCGSRGIFSDPRHTWGTVYAVAEKPEGPYRELDDNTLISCEGLPSGFSCRSVYFEGKRYLMYTDAIGGGASGALALPKELRTDAAGHLLACYSDRLEKLNGSVIIKKGELPIISDMEADQQNLCPLSAWGISMGSWGTQAGSIIGKSPGWSIQPLGSGERNFNCSLRIKPQGCAAAGLAFRSNTESWGATAFLDLEQQEIHYAEPPSFGFLHSRKARLEQDREYQLRVVAWGPQIEVYLDDVLLLQFARDATKEGQLGLFVDRGRAAFSDIVAHSLNVE